MDPSQPIAGLELATCQPELAIRQPEARSRKDAEVPSTSVEPIVMENEAIVKQIVKTDLKVFHQ